MARDYLRRASVLVVCGGTVDEAMKNDIAVAERLRITATTLDGILTVKGQGRHPRGPALKDASCLNCSSSHSLLHEVQHTAAIMPINNLHILFIFSIQI